MSVTVTEACRFFHLAVVVVVICCCSTKSSVNKWWLWPVWHWKLWTTVSFSSLFYCS